MLIIDDNKLKLIKMHEALLKVGATNKAEILEKYKSIVLEIDRQAYSDILADIERINEHNQSLEDELQFLDRINESYNQLLELQLRFKRVYELYGGLTLELSDLSLLNVDYIQDRISVINGYLINLKNIETNSARLQELSNNLVEEEKKRKLLSKRLSDMEIELKDNFLRAEGRDSKLQSISVISEYQALGYDFRELLNDDVKLEQLLSTLTKEKIEVEEKLRTAEICYNSIPNADSKQILDDIRNDYLNVIYRLVMVRIIAMLSRTYDSYDSFKEKRENILSLIKYRTVSLKDLGISFSVDPFGRTKVAEQLQSVLSLTDNSKNINRIRKEIAQLDERTEEMKNQNIQYLKSLGETKSLIDNRIGMNDVDVSSVTLDVESEPVVIVVLDNQVVGVRDVSTKFNMRIAKQKTSQVMLRVNGMFSEKTVNNKKNDEVINPQLVIVPKVVEQQKVDIFNEANDVGETVVEEEALRDSKGNDTISLNSDIFATVEPFVDTLMFVDRTDGDLKEEVTTSSTVTVPDTLTIASNIFPVKEERTFEEDKMPDAFWTTEEVAKIKNDEVDNDDTEEVSFDEQISALLSGNDVMTKSRKKAA